MSEAKKIAIIYVSYHCEPYLERAVSAWKKLDYPKDQLTLVVVDNPHPNYGSSADFIKENLLPLSGNDLPSVIFLPQEKNLGFAGGHNVGINWALAHGFDYVYLHNQDGFMDSAALRTAVAEMECDKTNGAVQSLVLLYPETGLINTNGNELHYLGFGYCGDYRKTLATADLTNHEIAYGSGAALLMRADLLKAHGLFDEDLFAYHEDLEYSLRLRSLGYKITLASASIFFHEYEFNRNPSKYYFMERNRLAVMLKFFKWPTLIILAPMEILMKIALFFVALFQGWLKSWWQAYYYWLSWKHWQLWLTKRKYVQTNRRVADKELLALATRKIQFDFSRFVRPLVLVGNLFLDLYWQLARLVIFW